MKLKFLKWSLFSLAGVLLIASCSSNEEQIVEQQIELNTADIQNLMITEDVSSEIELILEGEDSFDTFFKSSELEKSEENCFTRTVVRDEENNTKTVTLDFGDGCESNRGKVRTGKIIIVQQRASGVLSKTVSFENFSVDEKSVEGSKVSTMTRENENGNRERSFTSNITITLTTGEEVSLSQNKTREMVAGGNTLRRGDDVFSITGTSNFTNKEGTEISTSISQPLIRNYSCRFIVQGVKEVTRDGNSFSINFGDGSCDNLATVTDENGDTEEIELKRK